MLKNLDDTDKMLQKNNYKLEFSQALILTKNIQTQISEQIQKHKDKFQEYLDEGYFDSIPFNIKNINVNISLQNIYKENLNKLKDSKSNTIRDFLEANDIFEYEILKDIYKDKEKEFRIKTTKKDKKKESKDNDNNFQIESTKQLDDIMSAFIDRTYSNKIDKIKDNLGFHELSNYRLNINISLQGFFFKSYYILDKEGKVKNFEISFK